MTHRIDPRRLVAVLAALLGIAGSHSVAPAVWVPPISVVPLPRIVHAYAAAYFWPEAVSLSARTPDEKNVAASLRDYLRSQGVFARIVAAQDAGVLLRAAPIHGAESYRLRVGPRRILLSGEGAGLYYAVQTLEQITTRSAHGLSSRAVDVEDWPAYPWRGMHLDVARHFFPARTVERYIDVAAHYKFNVFHWHLTDDQAWRMPISDLPALTRGGRAYAPSEIRAVVAYARHRYVTVVPEIEMPAHASAALAAYPAYGCGDVICENATGIGFARKVLTGVMRAFPGPYVHVGGDEVPSPFDRSQSAFTAGIERFVEAHGRRIVGWDDILNDRLGRGAVVMAWNGLQQGAAAARRGNDAVIVSAPLYFDAIQGDAHQEPPGTTHMSTLEEVYDYDVMPAGIGKTRSHILGGQGILWTERIASPEHLFYMALPRELALAEVLWTPHSHKSWSGFLRRLPAQLAWLDRRGYAYRMPAPILQLSGAPLAFSAMAGRPQSASAWTASSDLRISIQEPAPALVRYTLDGSAPSPRSPAYRGPFDLRLSSSNAIDLKAAAFTAHRSSTVSECVIRRVSASVARARGSSIAWSSLVSP